MSQRSDILIILVMTILIVSPQVQAGLFSSIKNYVYQIGANYKVKREVKKLNKSALGCQQIEHTNSQQTNAFFANRPATPNWQHLKILENNNKSYIDRASKFSNNDKNRHCFAGYMIAKELSYKTAVFSAFIKEAYDVGDCNPNSHFELIDQDATIYGAQLMENNSPMELCHEAKDRYTTSPSTNDLQVVESNSQRTINSQPDVKTKDDVQSFIQKIKKSQTKRRELWVQQWPTPTTIYQELILYNLSLMFIPDKKIGSYDKTLPEVGILLSSIQDNKINSFLRNLLKSEAGKKNFTFRSLIYEYNSLYAVDYFIMNSFLKDIKTTNFQSLEIGQEEKNRLFRAILDSADIQKKEKMALGTKIAESSDKKNKKNMTKALKERIEPLI